jgi:MFS transporter, PPP family, 3-phenylpropionic acid transporter
VSEALSAAHRAASNRLAAFYFFYYATVGAFIPYWGPYLEARGFSALQIGAAFALMGVSRSIMPVAWGVWADRSGQRMRLIRVSTVVSLLLFLAIPLVGNLAAIAALMLAYSLFWHALLPQFEVVALNHVSNTGADYSRIRMWGSVGFVFAVLSLGPLLDRWGMLPLPLLVGLVWLGMVATAWLVAEPTQPPRVLEPRGALWTILRKPEVIALLLVCFASQLSFATYYNFFTLFLERHGYSRGFSGFLWALAVGAEIALFWWMRPLIQTFGVRNLMLGAIGGTAIRWAMTALAIDQLWVLIIAQLSHALTFGAFHAVSVHYVQRMFPGQMHGRGQAIYSAVSYGIGGSVGSLVGGWLWDGVSPESTFLVAALMALLGFWVGWRRLPK